MKKDRGDGQDKRGAVDEISCSGAPPAGSVKSERANVTGIQDWKKRASGKSARAALYKQKIQLLSTPQKQALLIRLIVCDDITPKDLDALLGVLVAHA
jgi:hypothetical protein